MKKYIAYAKQNIDPTLTDEAARKIKEFYVEMRNKYTGQDQAVPITLRQYEALIRLAEASAKIRLSTKIEKQDVERAIRLMTYSLTQLGIDTETGHIDIDRIESGISSSQRSKIREVLNIIEELEKSVGQATISDIEAEAESRGIKNVHEIIQKLKNEGTIYEPRSGILKKL